jgi:predicted ATPase
MSTRVTSSRLIGRSAELAELEAALADAASGRPSLAFLAGESGVGKTRLLSALHDRAVSGGARVLSGDCVELGDGELPYAAIVAALRPLARSGDPVLDELGAVDRAALGRLLPGLSGAEVPPVRDEATAQAQLFEALLALLEALGRRSPVVLAIEDLHWADRSTRGFVTFLARALCRERVLVVATYRSDELHRRHPLRPLLAELERDVRARRILLSPLSRAEIDEQLSDILGAPAGRALTERLWLRAGGNPLFTEELLAAGLDGRGTAPRRCARR